MFVQVHPAVNMLRGDASYRPCITEILCGAGGREIIDGAFQDDGLPDCSPARPDVPFKIFLPEEFGAWHALNAKISAELKRGSRFILIDETSS